MYRRRRSYASAAMAMMSPRGLRSGLGFESHAVKEAGTGGLRSSTKIPPPPLPQRTHGGTLRVPDKNGGRDWPQACFGKRNGPPRRARRCTPGPTGNGLGGRTTIRCSPPSVRPAGWGGDATATPSLSFTPCPSAATVPRFLSKHFGIRKFMEGIYSLIRARNLR